MMPLTLSTMPGSRRDVIPLGMAVTLAPRPHPSRDEQEVTCYDPLSHVSLAPSSLPPAPRLPDLSERQSSVKGITSCDPL